jgi:protein ImuA
MQLISCHAGELRTLSTMSLASGRMDKTFRTGMEALDTLLPGQSFARGAVHELLMPTAMGQPMFVAMLLAKAAAGEEKRSTLNTQRSTFNKIAPVERWNPIIWCDPNVDFYPPAAAAMGIPLNQFYLLHPKTTMDHHWAMTECLRCRGVAAVVAAPGRLSRIQARRLQLAAEHGGGVGILLRPAAGSCEYAAATRWLVTPAPGERTLQRWKMQLIHGHGGRIGQTVILEYSRETHSVRAITPLADRPNKSIPDKVERAIA